MVKILQLDEITINQIAAGEVITRPSAVVKECVENSIDAGATLIKVVIHQGGKAFISIEDNGCGMAKEDALLSLQRHATSKIHDIQDLFFLHTLGFRGEALASIASVSKLELYTAEENGVGTHVTIHGGKLVDVTNVALNQGTKLDIYDLFFNVPARLKYLKSDSTEQGHIHKIILYLALAYPCVAFQLYSNQKQIFSSSGDNQRHWILADIFGKEIATTLIIGEKIVGDIQVSVYVGHPSQHRGDKTKQIFLINQRVVGDQTLSRALNDAFSAILPNGRYPYALISLAIDPSEVDFNVHPTKAEVRFVNSQAPYHAVQETLKYLLNSHLVTGTLMSEPAFVDAPDIALKHASTQSFSPLTVPKYSQPISSTSATFQHQSEFPLKYLTKELPAGAPVLPTFSESLVLNSEISDLPHEILQMERTFLVFVYHSELIILDQHIAQERFFYEKFISRKEKMQSQQLLLPESLFVSFDEKALLHEWLPQINELGFDVEEFGRDTYIIRAVPVCLMNKNPKGFFMDLLAETVLLKQDALGMDIFYKQLACKSSVKAGDVLVPLERREIVKQWLLSPNHHTCPHGRPIYKTFALNEMYAWFTRPHKG